jgi:hypothetical protein
MPKFRRFNTRSARLTGEEVLQIREEYEKGTTQGELCRKYQVSVNTIGRIVRGETWTQLGGETAEHIYQRPAPTDAEIAASEQRVLEALQSDIAQVRKVNTELDELRSPKAKEYLEEK